MRIDIPSADILPELEKSIREQIKELVLPGDVNFVAEIEKMEWTKEGLSVWILTKK